jgi:hypothetical protein
MKKKALVLGILIAFATAPQAISPIIKTEIKNENKIEKTKATMKEKRYNKALAKRYAWVGYGWKDMQWRCVEYIFTKESRFDHLAKNKEGSSAFGIGQRLKETSTEPAIQILHAYKYIKHRYDTPCNAMKFHLRKNYY